MAGAGDDHFLFQIGRSTRPLVAAGIILRRRSCSPAAKRRAGAASRRRGTGQLPVAIGIADTSDSTRKPSRLTGAKKKSRSASISHGGSLSAPCGFDKLLVLGNRNEELAVARRVARRRVEDHRHRAARIGVEFILDFARLLEIELVEMLVAARSLIPSVGRIAPRGKIRNAEQCDRAKDVGTQQRRVPRHGAPNHAQRSPPTRRRGCLPARRYLRQIKDVVRLDSAQARRSAHSRLVGRDDAEARGKQARESDGATSTTTRPSVAQHDERPGALLDIMHPIRWC